MAMAMQLKLLTFGVTSPDAETGAVINSGWIDTPQWAIPDGVLQNRHYLLVAHLRPWLPCRQINWNLQQFKIDMRTIGTITQEL